MNGFYHNLSDIDGDFSTVVEVLRLRSFTQPNRDAFTFLLDGETEQTTLTYQELDRRSRQIAAQLQALGLTGERALLLYPAGLDFLVAFFGCLYAGVVAVTAYPPRNERNTPRIKAISIDAQAAIALTTTEILSTVRSLMSQKTDLESLQWLTTDNLVEGIEDTWQEPSIDQDTLAFLQYTSGSTGTPKGVMISHGNLLHNADTTYQFMEHSPESKFVTWLPMYHDMGLIGGILQPLYGGFPCIIMPPTSFLQRPYRWLQAISHYKGTTSGGPNFAYELCTQKITPEQKQTLDLSSWSVAFNGAEPIRYDTLERFAAAFADCGFRKEAFYPCYGMAETTLMVSGVQKATSPIIKTVQKPALESNRVVEASVNDENISYFISCGRVIPQQEVAIAHPDTFSSCKPNEIGEIWVSGPSVGQGYWNRPHQTAETFDAYLSDTGLGPFLRTGDLGFLQNGELFITGRAKDLIIIRGRNLYPQDIELTAERSHSSLHSGASAAFTVEVNNEERLVIVQELKFRAKPNLEEVISAIRQAVTEEHEVQVYAVVLIKPGSIPKTSSGKIQRRAIRTQFQNGELNVIGSDIFKISNIVRKETRLKRSELLTLSPTQCQPLLEAYLIEQEARVLAIAPDNINPEEPLSALGFDSLKVFELKNRIEVDLEVEVSIADFFERISTLKLVTKILAQITTDVIPSISLTQLEKTTSTQPLSYAQQGLWFINQLNPHTPTYNIPIVMSLKGYINLVALQDSLNEIIRRHEVLRTSFVVIEGQPAQIINQATPLTLMVEDLRVLSENERTQEAQRLAIEFAQQPFDLSCQSLLRAKILHLNDKNYQFLVTLHHIIADGWSISILIKELTALYEAFSTGKLSVRSRSVSQTDTTRSLLPQRGTPLPELPIQYQDFVNWQRQWLDFERIQSLLTYWKQKLGGDLTVLNLPTDRPRRSFTSCHQTSPVQTFKGAQAKLVLSQILIKELKNLSNRQGVTLFMTLLAAFKALLYRYTGQTDILVGSPIASRNRAEIESLIGFFVNVLVLRTDLSGELSFQELLARVKSTASEAYIHQDLPFGKLVQELQPTRDLSYHPLFQVMFVLQNLPKPNLSLSDVSVTYEEGYNGTSKFDLTLFIEDSAQGFIATCEYNTDLFNADTITRMLGHFQTLLESIVSDPKQCIADLQLLMPSEVRQLLVEWNNTKTDYPQDKCIHELFEAQVEKTPSDIAVIFVDAHSGGSHGGGFLAPLATTGGTPARQRLDLSGLPSASRRVNQQLTYQELNSRANQLAHYLQQLGVKPDVMVGICVERSIEMVVGLLAIMKAGGAYMPLDPAYPKERLAFTLADSQVSVLLANAHLVNDLPLHSAQLVCIDIDSTAFADYSAENVVSNASPENLAYVIYTSGSTGKPKGVQIPHSAVVNFLTTMHQIPGLAKEDILLSVTTLSFDIAALELYLPLIVGARLVLVNREVSTDGIQLSKHLVSNGITVMQATPATWRMLVAAEWQSKNTMKILCGGEALDSSLAYQLLERGQEVWNLYGPTETTIWSAVQKVNSQEQQHGINSIGRPIANTQFYILDPHQELVPIGVPGELHIGGVGLARGYWNRPELTGDKFIPSPFESGKRIYKTGDLARYQTDGKIEFLGRIDHQVKIRGFRIELGEIKALLEQHPDVQETVVVAREDIPNDYRIIAYLVTHKEVTLCVNHLRDFLKEKLPEYMLPSAFVVLDILPLTPNGKVDRRALPAPENLRPKLATAFQSPQSEIEKTIAQIWQQVLHLEKVGIHDNFFDLGGHSLLMLQVNNQLHTILQQDIPVVTMFQNPTIYSLAQYLNQTTEEKSMFEPVRDRVQKQIEIRQKQKQLFMKQPRNNSR
ncbi:non-ribosomal peptide synthetase [Nostoc sp. MG11]|uniref:non-ribosomal peptide synthetase n=1 Tax=Nostoc sp. MG11 TaxID=2721166 RepID=UPI001866113A|nr:non-ribosomal peptide synthetase [Nostoc sp. MG11]